MRYRGKIAPAPHAHPFVRRLVNEANRHGILLHEVADKAGVTRAAISKWRHQVTPHLVGLIACLNVVGLDLAVVPRRDGGRHDDTQPQPAGNAGSQQEARIA